MKDRFSASELAALALPGLPTSRPNVARLAKRKGWDFDMVIPAGGGKPTAFFHLSSLPIEAREAILQKHIAESSAAQAGQHDARKAELAQTARAHIESRIQEQEGVHYLSLPDRSQQEADAKLVILTAWQNFRKHAGEKTVELRERFCQLYNDGLLGFNPEIRRIVASLSVVSLYRWEKQLRTNGITGLASRYGRLSSREYRTVLDQSEEMRDYVLGSIYKNPHINARQIHRGLIARFGREATPSHRTIQAYLKTWKDRNRQEYEFLKNPDGWRSKYQVAFGNAAENVSRLNQIWEMDSTPGDVLLHDGKRYHIIGVVDVYSRRLLLHVVKTSTAAGIASLLRRALSTWGIPETIRTDNGADYTSEHIKRALADLGIEHDICPPFSPEKKPFIERALGTFAHGIVPLLDSYIGHNVTRRKEIEARKSFAARLLQKGSTAEISMTPEVFQYVCDFWCEFDYAHDPHEGLNHLTPLQKASGWQGTVRFVEDERRLDLLLAPAPRNEGKRTIRKEGIQINSHSYIAPELGAFEGENVQVYFDPEDESCIYVRRVIDGRFICIARCPDFVDVSRQVETKNAQQIQRQSIRDFVARMRAAAERTGAGETALEILISRFEETHKIKALPQKRETYTNDALEAAGEAVDARTEAGKSVRFRAEGSSRLDSLGPEPAGTEEGEPYARPQYWDSDTQCYKWVGSLPEHIRYDGRVQPHEWEMVRKHDEMQIMDVRYTPLHPEYQKWRMANPYARPPWFEQKGWGTAFECVQWAASLPEEIQQRELTPQEWAMIDRAEMDWRRSDFNRGIPSFFTMIKRRSLTGT